MAGGVNTALISGGVGALAGIIPPEYQSTFATGAQIAGINQAAPASTGPAVNNSVAPGPAPMQAGMLDKLMGFARSPIGIGLGVIAVAALGWKLYKGRR